MSEGDNWLFIPDNGKLEDCREFGNELGELDCGEFDSELSELDCGEFSELDCSEFNGELGGFGNCEVNYGDISS